MLIPWRVAAGTSKSPISQKKNDLNQTSMRTCSSRQSSGGVHCVQKVGFLCSEGFSPLTGGCHMSDILFPVKID